MAFTNLPPQAYTRDVLAAAYEWLRSQPASIRELATNSDNLVSLYMQSRRRPNSLSQLFSNNAESKEGMSGAGAEAFKNDLKNLAEGLKQFEDRPQGAATEMPQTIQQAVQQTVQQSLQQSPLIQQFHHQQQAAETVNTTAVSIPALPPSQGTSSPGALNLDARSLETVRKVQSLFNLSSEREALRFLIAVGFEKVKDFVSRGS